jgi:hypothetical protein
MIIPWTCHVCAETFDKYHGGVCFKCNKSTCSKHLMLVGYAKGQGPAKWEQMVCTDCVKPGETAVRFRKSLFSKIAWIRRLGNLA